VVGSAAMDAAQEKPDVRMQNGLHFWRPFFMRCLG
jgi:hypothetical protein